MAGDTVKKRIESEKRYYLSSYEFEASSWEDLFKKFTQHYEPELGDVKKLTLLPMTSPSNSGGCSCNRNSYSDELHLVIKYSREETDLEYEQRLAKEFIAVNAANGIKLSKKEELEKAERRVLEALKKKYEEI